MKRLLSAGGPAAPDAADFLLARLKGARRVARQVFGMLDYERYLEHARTIHPDRPPMSEGEFHAFAIDRRYGNLRARCC